MSIQATVDEETKELILFADQEGIEALVKALTAADRTVAVPLRARAGAPTTHPIASLTVRRDSGEHVKVDTARDSASIVGSASALSLLARELSLFVEYNDLYEPGMHTHFDPGGSANSLLGQDSRSLIVAGPVSEESERSPT